ncbi:MAG: DUF3084 domain-containing protein [Gloeobacterales cyanobacterium]
MTGGILVILAVLLIGGVVAAVGDRLGFKIGKARLSLFGLRPKDTAVWVTVFTGMTIAGLSLGLLLLVSDQVRFGLFQVDQLFSELSRYKQQEQQVQAELKIAKEERIEAEAKLQETLRSAEASNRQRLEAQKKQQLAQKSLQESQAKLKAADAQLQKAKQSYGEVQQQLVALKGQEHALEGRLDSSQKQLAQLGNQRTKLQTEIKTLAQQLVALQTKNNKLAESNVVLNTALRKGAVILQSGELMYAVRIQGGLGSNRLREALDSVLSQTEIEVRKRGAQPYYQFGQRAVLITNSEVERLVTELQKPGEHALQIFVAQNVLLGEPVPVVGRVLPNLHLFDKGVVMATCVINPKDNDAQLIAQLQKLFEDASRKARKAGILTNSQGEVGSAALPVDQMIGQIHQLQGPVVVQALTSTDIYTAGPLQLFLNVVQDGKVVGQFSSSG